MLKIAMLAATLVVSPCLAFADDGGAVTGAAGGAVAGAVVGGPVGAVVGGAAGAALGGAASGPDRTVVVEPASPCARRTTQTTDSTGYSETTRTTNCP
jgi:hypothetical protein